MTLNTVAGRRWPVPVNHIVMMTGGLLWLQSIQNALISVTVLRQVAMGLVVFYIALTWRRAQALTQRIALVCAGLILLGLATGTPLTSVSRGLDIALLFAGFFPALELIRWLIARSAVLDRIGARLGSMPARLRDHSTLVAAHALGAVMTMGAFAALSPSFEQLESLEDRQDSGLSAIRGVSLAVLWTPFTVGMGFASNYLPQVPLWQGIGCGLFLSAIGMMISLGERNPLKLGPSLVLVREMGLPLLFAAAFLVIGNAITGMSGVNIIIVATPVFAVAVLLLRRPTDLPLLGAPIRRATGGMGNEMMLFSASICMGTVMAGNPHFQAFIGHLGVAALPVPVVFAIAVALAFGAAMAGMHSSVIGALIIAFTSSLDGLFDPLVVFVLIIFGWFCGAMISLSSLSVTIVTRSFGTPLGRILHGPNLRFAAEMSLVMIAAFTVLYFLGLA